MSDFVKFPSIPNFHNLYRSVQIRTKYHEAPIVRYRAKIKLHGTNAGIRIDPDGTVTAQKRNSDIKSSKDNAGFAAWVEHHHNQFSKCAVKNPLVIFGEWAGPGIQKEKGIAVNKILEKSFFIFAAQHDGNMIVCPRLLSLLVEGVDVPNVYILPWFGDDTYVIDFADRNFTERRLESISKTVNDIEKQDPYIANLFGFTGVGEGLVFVPCQVGKDTPTFLSRDVYSDYIFKAKGKKHQVTKQRKPVFVDPEVAKSIDQFIQLTVTENRLQQGLDALGDDVTMADAGKFLKWLGGDVKNECQAELEVAGLEWKDVSKKVNFTGIEWFKRQMRTL